MQDLIEFDAAHYLDSERAIATFLADIIQENNVELLAKALDDVARARGITELAKVAGISRASLVRALQSETADRSEILGRVCAALRA